MKNLLQKLSKKQKRIASFRPFPPELMRNLDQWLKVELTYTSNAIEGNTLSRQETALIIEKGLTIGGKSLNEHLEAINHAAALDFIKKLIKKKPSVISEKIIMDIHRIILSKIDDANAGCYRRVAVRIAGSRVIMPNPLKVPDLMNKFISWLQSKNTDSIVKKAADAHFQLVSIHPFTDGNGRTARLLMNLLLMQAGYPPALIRKEDRLAYVKAIEKGQLFGSMEDYYHVIFKSIDRSLNIYLKAVENPPSNYHTEVNDRSIHLSKNKKLLKIGELARLSREQVPTIRYWTKEGLLEVAEYSPGGYQLYESSMINQIKKIRNLQEKKRFSIKEIKASFKKK